MARRRPVRRGRTPGRRQALGDPERIRIGSVDEDHREILADHADHVGGPEQLDQLPGHDVAEGASGAPGWTSRTRKRDKKS